MTNVNAVRFENVDVVFGQKTGEAISLMDQGEGRDAILLLQPVPLGDVPAHVRERAVGQAMANVEARAGDLTHFAERRAEALLADHRRVREAADARGMYTVKAVLPGGGTPGQVRIWSPEGRPLGTLHLPQPPGEPRARVCATNVAFGDPDDRGLYITACTHLFKVRMKIPGVRPGHRRARPAAR